MSQKEIWERHALAERPTFAVLERPAQFQQELAALLDMLTPPSGASVAEAGCEFGVTSFLLTRPAEKVALDYNEVALMQARALWIDQDPAATAVCADLFALDPSLFGRFDLVFNAGVIEHYEFNDRVRMIDSMLRMAKPGAPVVVAFPNHLSFPYRIAYLVRRWLRIWRFPAEFKLPDLRAEAKAAGAQHPLRVVLAEDSIRYWSDPWYLRWLKIPIVIISAISKPEGYLTVCVLRRG